ncbi:MAG: BON domain-containing protein [Proteobacteria bacterium]|nr:BON domain-containing protein [Pseudomonadota bacterium]MBU4294634.1 BON domain-containing protein [Pseudomonadota bacterium]MCG2745907.1 BON domain-containing protein [Desulfobulbaceae bacterium]
MKPFNLFANFFLVILLVSFLGCASTAKQEGTGEYIDDSVITTKVKAEILKDETLKSSEINVETFKGVVQLSGFVSSPTDIDKAVEVASSVKGVTSVKNDMRVKGKR